MRDRPPPPEPGPGDYYFDDRGLMVFTRQYHVRRGYCCQSGCKHCPWDYAARKAAQDEKETAARDLVEVGADP